MNEILTIANDEREIYKIKTSLEFIKESPFFVKDLNQASNALERTSFKAIFISENIDMPIDICLKELKRIMPLMPIFVLLKNRDYFKKEEFIKLGAFDIVNYPWTSEEFKEVLKKTIFSFPKEEIKYTNKKKIKNIIYLLFFSILFLVTLFSYNLGKNKEKKKIKNILNPKEIELPVKNISGLFFDKENIYIYDWLLQTIYKYNKNNFNLINAKKLPFIIAQNISDFKTSFFILRDDFYIENRLKDENFTLISKSGPFKDISQSCFDGMYVWTMDLKSQTISKRINNSSLEIIKTYPLPNNVSLFTCSEKNIFYYETKNNLIQVSSFIDPEKIILELSYQFDKKINFISYNDNKLFFILKDKDKDFLTYENLKEF